jgi:phosphoribosylamine--glycine ligase / phosphoribosylformylglycinamidine cyclo-ligase
MNVLIVGSGGREHTLAWKISQSPQLTNLYIAPGNPGMAELGTLVPISVEDPTGLQEFSRQKNIDLVVIGPEAALAAGVSDAIRAVGVPVFGPSRAAAQIETSKRFSKEFMARHAIPTARFETFTDYLSACNYLKTVSYPVVIKASGLAAGKGVILPETLEAGLEALESIMVSRQFGAAGDEIIIEERLEGEEVSLLAFCDGVTVKTMPPAQDHKRLLDRDQGPNTGGMGAYAPAPVLSADAIVRITQTILQPVLDGLRGEGLPFVGVLYTGLILTQKGPMVLEFNARFGDPETQVILPLLESDLLEILAACTRGELAKQEIRWAERAAVCVVLASGGYPEKPQTGFRISGLEHPLEKGMVFHAGTGLKEGNIVNSGGRVLGVTAWDADLTKAIEWVYQGVEKISFEGMQYRKDIAQKALNKSRKSTAYNLAGVDIDAGNRAVELMKTAVQSTYTERVLAGIGSFGGLFDASDLGEHPVLVASTDGVGTKVELAARLGRVRGVGEDIVNHCINDILVQGARPLFFMDYLASSKLDPGMAAEVVSGMSAACKSAGCVLLGGETAEMPGVYQAKAFDVAGTMIGIVEREKILPRHTAMKAGDVLIGFASSGPHTNGFSLIRKIIEGEDLFVRLEELESNLADVLLKPHRSYLELVWPILPKIKGLAHLTGGSFIENVPRMLPEGLQAVIDRSAWAVPPLFRWLQKKGGIDPMEMYRIFNMGIGLVAVVDSSDVHDVLEAAGNSSWKIGQLRNGNCKEVVL